MITFLIGAVFALITLLAVGLQRTYYHYPLKELKRQARAGDRPEPERAANDGKEGHSPRLPQ